MKNKLLLMAVLLMSPMFAMAGDGYLCSYTAYISSKDKVNSSGKRLASGVNKSSVAAILRQDRANFYRFGKVDGADTSDCMGHSTDGRARLERLVRQSDISQSTMRRIVNGNPVINVEIYRNFVYIYPETR